MGHRSGFTPQVLRASHIDLGSRSLNATRVMPKVEAKLGGISPKQKAALSAVLEELLVHPALSPAIVSEISRKRGLILQSGQNHLIMQQILQAQIDDDSLEGAQTNYITPFPEPYDPDPKNMLDGEELGNLRRKAAHELLADKMLWHPFGVSPDVNTIEFELFKQGSFSQLLKVNIDGNPQLVVEIPRNKNKMRAETIAKNQQYFEHYWRIGRRRFLPKPYGVRNVTVADQKYTIGISQFLGGYEELGFEHGTLWRWEFCGERSRLVKLPEEDVADVLAEVIASIVYHYEPEAKGGTTIANYFLNAGDTIYRKSAEDRHELRLISIRERKTGVSIPRFVRSLVDLMAVDNVRPKGDKIAAGHMEYQARTLSRLSNPSVAFHGIVRGLVYLYEEKGLDNFEEKAQSTARQWISSFIGSEQSRPYHTDAERFLRGELPLSFGKRREGYPSLKLLLMGIEEISRIVSRPGTPSAMYQLFQQLKKMVGEEINLIILEVGNFQMNASQTLAMVDVLASGQAEHIDLATVYEMLRKAGLRLADMNTGQRILDEIQYAMDRAIPAGCKF
ncbi:MAG: hypothetical protein WC527_05670 [Candidatus Margulisiibacteriota bacterium]